MALESEPQSTLIGGSNLDALKSESTNNVDLEDGEIDDDEEEVVPHVSKATEPASTSVSSSKPTFASPARQTSKSHDPTHRDSPPWPQQRAIHNSTANKSRKGLKRNWEPPHKKSYHNDEEEVDDFAISLEKALREKAQKQAVKDGLTEEGEAEGSDGDDHGRKRKKRKTRWDDDDERDTKHRRRSRDGDEDDMIFVRGASPNRHENRDPSSFDFKNSFDTYPEEEEDYDECNDRNNHGGFPGRGRGRGNKLIRGRGRGRLGIPNEGLRGTFNKRGIKRGNLRGGSLGKSSHMLRDRMQDNICAYFMQGKCAKGPEDCPYSHDAQPPRKMELCKFYLNNCCAKREKCLYMHKDFPCKFFHTGRRCDHGDHCRFSHDKLSDVTRSILLKHLELAPKEILGEFKRFTREQANQIIDKAAKLRAQGKNPEGINLLTCDDEGAYNSGDERAHTPMPTSPGEPVPQEDFKRSRDDGRRDDGRRDDGRRDDGRRDDGRRDDGRRDDGRRDEGRRDDGRRDDGRRDDGRRDEGRRDDGRRDDGRRDDGRRDDGRRDEGRREDSRREDSRRDEGHYFNRKRDTYNKYRDYDKSRSRDVQHELHDKKDHGEKKDREKRRKRRWDSPDSSPSRLEMLQQQLREELLLHEISEGSSLNRSTDSTNSTEEHRSCPEDEVKNQEEKHLISSEKNDKEPSNKILDKKDSEIDDMEKKSADPEKQHEHEMESGGESQDSSGAIPLHLPKKQRELFMRIQQHQMRDADQSNENKQSESSDDPPPEDDWYSSDEDGPTSLTDLIKSLPKGQRVDNKSSKVIEEETAQNKLGKASIASPPENTGSSQTSDSIGENSISQPRRPALLPTPLNLTDLMKSSAIDQLLSSIRYGSQSKSSPPLQPTSTPNQVESTGTPVGLQSPGQMHPAAVPVRDPRLARDPRTRVGSGSGAAVAVAVSVVSPLGSPSSAPTPEPRGDPRLERERGDIRSDPRLDRRDPRTDPRVDYRTPGTTVEPQVSPRAGAGADVRPVDPRAARMEARRTSEGSSSSTGSGSNICHPSKSIYDGAGLSISGSSDIDLRVRGVSHNHIHGPDFHLPSGQLGSGDMDMRRPDYSVISLGHPLPAHDTDLRFGLNNSLMDIDADYTAASHSDLDLRRLEMILPFKPAPMHTAATEINASLSSYSPAPYRVKLIDIPRPDFSSLKINQQDPQAKLDPRLRRLFRLSQDELPSDSALLSPTSEAAQVLPVSATPTLAPSDPRRRNSAASRPADPRQGRVSSGNVGFCPPTPRVDDFDEPNTIDLEHQNYYGQTWDGIGRGPGLLPTPDHPESIWAPPGRSRPLLSRPPYLQQRSYTPPQS